MMIEDKLEAEMEHRKRTGIICNNQTVLDVEVAEIIEECRRLRGLESRIIAMLGRRELDKLLAEKAR